jgi:hypothetical protein
MPDDDNVIGELEARRTRSRRQPPPHRPARGVPSAAAIAETSTAPLIAPDRPSDVTPGPPAPAVDPPTTDRRGARRSASPKQSPSATSETIPNRAGPPPGAERLRVGPDEPIANFAVRVRRPLDDLAFGRLAELRLHGIRVTKVELTEMLLWELHGVPIEDLQTRLEEFRRHAR